MHQLLHPGGLHMYIFCLALGFFILHMLLTELQHFVWFKELDSIQFILFFSTYPEAKY